MMKLLVQPGDGIAPLVKGINDAEKTIQILIFRFDRVEIENALIKAVSRGVDVRALIAYTNRGGEKSLRALEMRLLAAGVTVARTDDDLVRYHGKMLIVDHSELFLMAFNFTMLDIERSRSFAIVTDNKEIVQEAVKLFNADSKRTTYTSGMDTFVVSPVNARERLAEFIKDAKTELLIYDPAIADPAIARILSERSKAGVQIKVLGRLSRKVPGAEVHKLYIRLHTRVIVRDREDAFLGSQSLRTAELDARREVGLIFHEPKITSRLTEVFEDDWKESSKGKDEAAEMNEANPPVRKVAKRVAKTVTAVMPPVAPVLEVVVRELAGPRTEVDVDPEELEAAVKDAVKDAIQETVASAVKAATSRAPE